MINREHTEASNGLSSAEVLERLCLSLSIGIHGAAQPLTILRAGLSEECISDLSEGELRELAADCSREAARLNDVFDAMRQLVSAERGCPQLSSEALNPLLEHSAREVNRLFRETGVQLHLIPPAEFSEVLVHRDRTLKALTDVLRAALSVSCVGDTVELGFVSTSAAAEIEIRNPGSTASTLDPEFSLRMAAAEASVRRQRGRLSWSMAPFAAQIVLAIPPGSAQGSLR